MREMVELMNMVSKTSTMDSLKFVLRLTDSPFHLELPTPARLMDWVSPSVRFNRKLNSCSPNTFSHCSVLTRTRKDTSNGECQPTLVLISGVTAMLVLATSPS